MAIAVQRREHTDHAALEAQLLSGGDARLALDPASGLNIYGCAPRPRGDIHDFSSSTASSISGGAYRRVEQAWHRLSRHETPAAIETLIEGSRSELKAHLGLEEKEAEIVFSPSGTDAQLLALFLVRALLGIPLVSIVVGADQTGSGAAYTARGQHFAGHENLRKGDGVEGLAEGVRSVAIPFCDREGNPHALTDLDSATISAVEAAIAGGANVLLQAMASSKLGWAAPSSACLDALVRRWPDKVRVVVDACQMRIGTARLRDYLARGYIVLATGSKFYCGPPFSGALLIPAALRDAIGAIGAIVPGIRSCATRFDWPACWPKLHAAFPALPNIGQWLRWEAALGEMRAYHAVPQVFRAMVLRRFAQIVPGLIAASPWLSPLSDATVDSDSTRDGEFSVPTIFSFRPLHPDRPFTHAECAVMHRLLNRDISSRIADTGDFSARRLASRHCHIGQPVAIGPGDGAVLRISSSARLVTHCWSPDPAIASARLDGEIAKVETVIAKLGLVARHFQALSS